MTNYRGNHMKAIAAIAVAISGALITAGTWSRRSPQDQLVTNVTNSLAEPLLNRSDQLVAKSFAADRADASDGYVITPEQPAQIARTRDSKLVQLSGEVPAALAHARKTSGSGDGKSDLTLTVVLKRTDPKGFAAALREVQNPQSREYGRYLNPREQADRFGPTLQAYKEVSDWLQLQGFSLSEESTNRLTITVRGTRAQAEKAFSVRLDDYQLNDHTFYSNDRDPALPVEIAAQVQSVIGLTDIARPVRAHGTNIVLPPEYDPQTNLARSCSYAVDLLEEGKAKSFVKGGLAGYICMAEQLNLLNFLASNQAPNNPTLASLKASGLHDAAAGSGQKIGLLEFDNFQTSDVKDFLNLIGHGSQFTQLSQVHVAGGAGAAGAEQSEVLLDVDAVMSLAPGAQVVVYDGPFNGRGSFQTMFNAMINDGVNVISNSWAYCEDQTTLADVQSIDSILASAAAAGITVVTGSGDKGSTCLNGSPNTCHVPATSPHITAVGGSTVVRNVGGTYGGESWWNSPAGGQGGFGLSKFFTRPSYQNAFPSASSRSVPDVTAPADPITGYFICQASDGGCPTHKLYGGTSVAAPVWAAFVAVLNQKENRTLGFLNPILYPLANTSAFHSATELGTDFQHVGLGSPNVDLLHLALIGGTAGPFSVSKSVLAAFPDTVVADGATQGGVVVGLLDANGNSVSGQSVQLTMNGGSQAVIQTINSVTNVSNGAALFTVTDTFLETVTFTATVNGVPLSQHPTIQFVSRPAAAGGISATPTTVTANGTDTTTITVTLQDANSNPSPGKVINLSQGNGASIISATTATTDATGKVQFTAVSVKAEAVTYTAVDVTDGNLPVPGSAVVNFVNASGSCGGNAVGTAAPGYAVTTFASNFPLDCFTNLGPIGLAFNANGTLFVGDRNDNGIYAFGPQGGIAGPATLVGKIPFASGASLAGLTFTKDGRLYAGMNNGGQILEVNPATGAVIRVVATSPSGPLDMHVDPLSGDLFFSVYDGIYRITNFANGPGTVTPYSQGGGFDGFVFDSDGTIYFKGGTEGIYRANGTNTQSPGTFTQLAFVFGGADGIALEPNPSNPSKPFLYVNRNDGIITRIDLGAAPSTVFNCDDAGAPCTNIFTGGSRGDFVTVGPSGCLFATQSDRVIRVTKADGTCSLTPTNPAPQIVVTPANVQPSPAQGTNVAFIATVKNVSNPVDIPITLFVSGANPGSHLVKTDANGVAVISYTGIATGTDQVFASGVAAGSSLVSNGAQVTWTPGKHSSFLTLNQSPSSGSPNKALTLTATLVDISVLPPAPINGAAINFSVAGQMCMGTTDGNGIASCAVTPTLAPGPYPLTSTFGGTSQLLSSSASTTVELLEALPPTVQFDSTSYTIGEGGGNRIITVTRTGGTSGSATVDYRTTDTDTFTVNCATKQGQAYGRCDFATVVGALSFGPGEASKTFSVPIINDSYAEGPETFSVVLSNPTGVDLGTPGIATVTITDNETVDGLNPILQTNSAAVDFFVRQHYLDFLGREPEPGQPWSNVLNGCADQFNTNPNSPSAGCDRITVSGAFFGSPEYKDKGFYVIDMYRVALNRLPQYTEFTQDLASITGVTAQETFTKRAAYATSFAQRTEVANIYGAMTNTQFVNALMSGSLGQNYNQTTIHTTDPASPDTGNKVTLTTTDLINGLNGATLTRAQVLRAIAQSDEISLQAEALNAFVASQYYGYLRRTPDAGGFNNWVTYLRNNPNDFRTMVHGFLDSAEYRLRFGPL